MNNTYVFKSERLGFRNWEKTDLNQLAEINKNPKVMEHFHKSMTLNETENFIERAMNNFNERGYRYFATEILETGEFIGMGYETYDNEFYPATNIGWRLKESAWGKGYATEGAKKCIDYAFTKLNIEKIVASCIPKNVNSERIMEKIGMTKKGVFIEPIFKEFPDYEKFFCYEIKQQNTNKDYN